MEVRARAEETGTYAVLVLDLWNVLVPEEQLIYEGFPTRELAVEFARRSVRDSLEDLRTRCMGAGTEELRSIWSKEGYDAAVIRGSYRARDEIEFFIEHPATAGERDWRSLLNEVGLKIGQGAV